MKKNLFSGIAALLLCGAFTSCSHDIGFDEQAYQKQVQDTYEKAFIARFGTPSANQDWGFGSSASSARTRAENNAPAPIRVGKTFNATLAAANYNTWENSGWEDEFYKFDIHQIATISNYSDDYLAQIRNAILTQIPENLNNLDKVEHTGYSLTTKGGPVTLTPIYHNSSSADMISYYYYPKNSKPSAAEIKKMKKYQVSYMANPDDCKLADGHELFYHNTFRLVYVDENNNASYDFPADYEICFIITNYDLAHMTTLNLPGRAPINQTPEFYGDGELNEQIHSSNLGTWKLPAYGVSDPKTSHIAVFAIGDKNYVGFEDWVDFDYNDVIFEVKGTGGGKPVPPVEEWEELRVIAEDLTVEQSTDFDFNDVVFDVRRYTKTTENHTINDVELIIRAAGGTLPLYVNGQEVHELFGVDLDVMVNTNAQSKGLKGAEKEPVTIKLTPNQYSGSTIAEIANSIVIYVVKNGVPCYLSAPRSGIASKIGVKCDYEWCDERQDIDKKYKLINGTPLFKSYVQGIKPYQDNWYRYAYNCIYGITGDE